VEINDLRKLFLNFRELEQSREHTSQAPREISRKIMKINDLQKAYPANQRLSAARASCPVAADESRRIQDDHAGLVGRPQRVTATTVRAPTPGPPTYVGSYELAWRCF